MFFYLESLYFFGSGPGQIGSGQILGFDTTLPVILICHREKLTETGITIKVIPLWESLREMAHQQECNEITDIMSNGDVEPLTDQTIHIREVTMIIYINRPI